MAIFTKKQEPHADEGDVAAQLARLNRNIERYLAHLRVPRHPEGMEIDLSQAQVYVGEPLDDVTLALKEHAELYGHEWREEEPK